MWDHKGIMGALARYYSVTILWIKHVGTMVKSLGLSFSGIQVKR